MTQLNLLDFGVAIPETADPDDIIKPNKVERLVLPGDVWKLGEHFVICGDATSPADLDFDEKENKFIPVGHLEELRGYILEKEQEGNI